MRYEVVTTLILCGTLLVLAPPISDYLARRQVVEVFVARTEFNNVTLNVEPLSSEYRLGCWILGAAMICIGVFGAMKPDVRGKSPGGDGL